MYKIIACDLDETLLKLDRTIDPKDIDAIQKAKALGVKFVPSTGRGYNSVQGTLKELGLFDEDNEYVISYNGGAITENKDNKIIHFEGISFELAEELYKRGLNYDVCIHVYTKDMVYAYHYVQEEIDYLASRMEVTEIFDKNIDFLKGQEIVKVLYMNTDYAYLNQIEEDLKEITQDIDVSYSSNRYIEFNHRGVNKGAGLLSLAQLLNVDIKDTIAIGDNFNDLSMIKVAGLGIGVQNAVEGMKKDCDYITEATCNESAISEVIHKFILDSKRNIDIKHVSNQEELQQCLQIRNTVFVVGMNVPQSIEVDQHDNLEDICDHFLIKYKNINVGTIRCLPISSNTIKLQRFAIYDEYRNHGFGKETLKYIEKYYQAKGYQLIVLDAQMKAYDFYEKNGYQKVSNIFIEAGIEHVKMEKYLKQ